MHALNFSKLYSLELSSACFSIRCRILSISSVVYGITGGLGFLLAIVLFASIRERLVFADYPKCWDGFPIALVTAGLMALAFMGFSGLKIW